MLEILSTWHTGNIIVTTATLYYIATLTLRNIPDGSIHQPWLLVDGSSHGYPPPIVDHAKERDESLARLEEIKV